MAASRLGPALAAGCVLSFLALGARASDFDLAQPRLRPSHGFRDPGSVVRPLKVHLAPNPSQVAVGLDERPDKYARLPEQDPLTEQGRRVHGVYISAPVVRHIGIDGIIGRLRAAGGDAILLDMKEDHGWVVYPSQVEAARPALHVLIEDPAALVRRLHARGIYVIARVVCFKDSSAARAHPRWAMRDVRPNRGIWLSYADDYWLDPHSLEAQDYLIAIAREMEAYGFDEVNFDYIRFPADAGIRYVYCPYATGEERYRVIARFLRRADQALGIPVSIDVFGLNAFNEDDENGLGQWVEYLAPHAEVVTPMLYINNFPSGYWAGDPSRRHIDIALSGVRNLRRRLGTSVAVRPLLQGFEEGANIPFGEEFIHGQALAAARARADGFLFWNPRVVYQLVYPAIRAALVQERALAAAEAQSQP